MYTTRRPPQKKLPFIVAFIVLAAAFGLTLRYGIMHREGGAWIMIVFAIVAIGLPLFYWLKVRKPKTPVTPIDRNQSNGPGTPINRGGRR